MKKLLPLLALTSMMLVGCGSLNEVKGRDFGWKTLKPNEYIQVHFSNNSLRYVATADIEIKYQYIAYESVAEVYVEETHTNGYHQSTYYIGTDLTVFHYEV